MSMRALIVDDERLARKELTSLLAEHPNVEIIGEAANADEATEKIAELDPDLVFLDIEMPGKNGFELLESLDRVPRVVFITAYDEFAIKAFEFNALDYLLKPVEPQRLKEAVGKLEVEFSKDSKEEAEAEPQSKKKKMLGAEDQVFVKDGDKCWFVSLATIRLFESDGNYIKVYFDKYKPMIHKSLNALDDRLDDRSFFRASRKHIINLNWVESIESWFNGGLMVKLRGGEQIEVSRRQAAKFKEMMSL